MFDTHHFNPRIASAGQELLEAGVNLGAVRLPQVHDTFRQGLISPYIASAREKGLVGYVNHGANRWAAGHVSDVAKLYVLAIERAEPGTRYHAVAEEGVAVRDIAEAVAGGLWLPAVSLSKEEADSHFDWFAMFAAADITASSTQTREQLGWAPTGPDLLDDLRRMDYSTSEV